MFVSSRGRGKRTGSSTLDGVGEGIEPIGACHITNRGARRARLWKRHERQGAGSRRLSPCNQFRLPVAYIERQLASGAIECNRRSFGVERLRRESNGKLARGCRP